MVMQPAGNGNEHLSLMCDNSEGCGESDLPVSSLASSGNCGRRFEVELAEGEAVSASISEIIGTRRMTVERAETEETTQPSIEINGDELHRVNGIVRFMAGRGFNTWRIHWHDCSSSGPGIGFRFPDSAGATCL